MTAHAVGVRPVVEGGVQRVEGERLPGAAGRGVVAARRRPPSAPAASPTARATAVHADVVVPVGDEQDHRLALLRLPQVEVGGRLGGVAVEGLALLVGVDRALDQPPGLAGGDVAADLDVVQLLRERHVGAEELAPATATPPRCRGSPRRRAHGCAATTADHGRAASEQRDGRGAGGPRANERAPAALRPISSQTTIGTSASARAAHQRVDDEVGQHLADPRLGALGLAGDQGVPVDQLVGARRRRSCRAGPRRRPAPPVGTRTSGSTGPVSSTTWPDRSGRITASWLASVVSRLLCRKMTACCRPRSAAPTHTSVRRADEDPARPDAHGLGARLRDRVEGDRGGDAGVEGLDLVGHRDRDAAGRRSRRPGGTGRRPRSRPRRPAGRRPGRGRAARRRRPRPGRPPCSRPPGRLLSWRTRLTVWATGIRAAAPALVFQADAVMPAARRSGMTTPCAPKPPRCGSRRRGCAGR